jgi:hypothetical protein
MAQEPATALLIVVLTNILATPGRGATRSVNSFLTWRSEFGLMPET